MKLAFKNRRAVMGVAIIALLLSPSFGFATEPTHPQPKPQTVQVVQEFTKTIKKEFPITATGTVDLSNKYGKVDVHSWERNRVKIDVTIVVDARSESSAQEVFDRIQIDFNNDDDFVQAETSIETNKSWWGGSSKSQFQINYQVYMPESCNLNLSNRYGDSNVEPIAGKADIAVKYGNFQLDGVGGDLKVYLGYGNGTVTKARNVAAEVSYSKINLNEVQDVNFETKYSKVSVDKGASIKADSRYDQFNLADVDRFNCESRYGNVEIGEAETIIAVSRYTDYKVDHLADSGDFDLEYGGLRVADLAKGFSTVVLNGRYSDFKIYVEPGASYTLDGATNYAGIAYPTEMNVTFEKDKGTSHEVKGHVGTSGARSTIKANLSYGGLKVRHKE